MRIPSLMTLAVAAGALAAAAPAAAVTVVMQYSGHVANGFDVAGLFGTAGANIAGLAFTATTRFDMPLPQAALYLTYDPFETHLLINGHDHLVPYVLPTPPNYQPNLAGFFAFGTGGITHGYSILSALVVSPNIHLFAWVVADNLLEANGAISGPTDRNGSFNEAGDSLALHIETFSMSPPPALPEPASWALMVGGFGMVGAALRGQRPRHATGKASV